jgi:hypothetical protein
MDKISLNCQLIQPYEWFDNPQNAINENIVLLYILFSFINLLIIGIGAMPNSTMRLFKGNFF